MKKLYIGNLSWSADDQALGTAFGQFGEVTEAKIVFDRETNRSRGFGFVTFASEDDAKVALEKMNESELMGRKLRVSWAEDRRGGDRGDRRSGGYQSRF